MKTKINDEWKKRYEKLLELIDGVEYSAQQWQEIVEEHLGIVKKKGIDYQPIPFEVASAIAEFFLGNPRGVKKMQIEIDNKLVERIKRVQWGKKEQDFNADSSVNEVIENVVKRRLIHAEQKLLLEAPTKEIMFRTKTWIPVEIDPKDDVLYSRRGDAEEEKARLEEMQPENKYETEEVDEVKC